MVKNHQIVSPADPDDNKYKESGLFSNYEIDPLFYDEMFTPNGEPREHYRILWETLNSIPFEQIVQLQEQAERSFLQDGITFSVYGEEGAQERIIPIDFLPRLINRNEWAYLEMGLAQRLQALNSFLTDIYGEARILADGVIPPDLVYRCPHYRIEMAGITLPHDVHVTICGSDLVRDNKGYMVLEDNLRSPSGVSYMLSNRQAIRSSLRTLYRSYSVLSIGNYTNLLYQSLAEIAPIGVSDPCIVLLTPGVYNSAYYEHMFLAREMGVELVEGNDLLVNNGFVYMRTTQGLRRVDVIYRRLDDNFIDPLVFRADSQLGVPGLFHAFRLGNVAIANAPGTGVADDKAVYYYVPDMIRYYLAEEPIIPNVETHLCREPEGLEYTLDNLDKLVVKQVGESGGYGMLVGPHASQEKRDDFSREIMASPENYISQPTLHISRAPSMGENGTIPCHVDLRPFILQGRETRIVPGAFGRVALRHGSLVVNTSQGGGGKDVWVLEN